MEIGSAFGDRNHIARAQFHEEAIQAVVVYAWKSVSKAEDLLYSSQEGKRRQEKTGTTYKPLVRNLVMGDSGALRVQIHSQERLHGPERHTSREMEFGGECDIA